MLPSATGQIGSIVTLGVSPAWREWHIGLAIGTKEFVLYGIGDIVDIEPGRRHTRSTFTGRREIAKATGRGREITITTTERRRRHHTRLYIGCVGREALYIALAIDIADDAFSVVAQRHPDMGFINNAKEPLKERGL